MDDERNHGARDPHEPELPTPADEPPATREPTPDEPDPLAGATLAHASDVANASRLARGLVEAGLEPSVPPLDLDDRVVARSAVASRGIDVVGALLAAARETALGVVASHRDPVVAIAGWIEAEAVAALSVHPRPRVAVIDPASLRARLAEALGKPATAPASDNGHATDAVLEAPVVATAAH